MLHPLPKVSADAHEGVLPHAYRIVEHAQLCACCGATHRWSETFAVTHLKSRLEMSKYVTNLRPLDQPQYNLPIEHVKLGPVRVPFCHACNSPSLHDLPSPPKSFAPRKMKDAPEAKAPKAPPVKHTAADLAALLRKGGRL